MNRELVVDPHERLLEVLLEETLRPESGAASSPAAAAPSPSRRRSVWLAAALALLGIGVVIGVAALRRSPGAVAAPAQDPQPAPSKQPWQVNSKSVASQAEWLAWAPQVTGVLFKLVRPLADGKGLEVVDDASDYVGGPEARDLAALVPPLGEVVFDASQAETPPFDAWIAFESAGMRVHGFVRLWNQPTLVIGSRRAGPQTDAWQKAMQKMWMQAVHRQQVARGVVRSLDELEAVPETTKAIRCPPMPNGTLEKHLGRFKNLEHLEFVFTTTGVTGEPISLQLPETPTTLFEEMQALPKLRHLRVSGLLLSGDARAEELARLPNLVSLRLDGSVFGAPAAKIGVRGSITAAGMRVLARKIEALELVDCDLTSALLEPWLEAAQLRKLVLFGDAMTPELLARFARLPTLTELGLGGVAWSDAHLQALAGSKLTRLRLEHTQVTGAALLRLPASLRTLDLRRQMFDESPYGGLKVALPECRILRSGDVDATDPPLSDVPGGTRR